MTSDALSTAPTQAPLVLELVVDAHPYRIVLPHAETDYIQKKLATERVPYELEMLEDLRARVPTGGLVLDVGANIGNHTLFLSMVAACRVEAFEPNPELCDALRRSIAINGLSDQVHLHETGLGRTVGHARFGVSSPANLGGQHLELGEGELRIGVLDHFVFDGPVQAIKIDVEGMEIDVLEGARELLKRDRPLLYVECGTEATYRRMSRWMSTLDYTYWDTFNATPTHLFIPAERLSVEQRLQHLQAKSAQNDYKSNQLLREIRQRASKAQEGEREARSRMAILEAEQKVTSQHLADERHRAAGLRESLSALRSELGLAHRALEKAERVRSDFDTSRRALDQSKLAIQKLTRIVEVREVRLAATERREAALNERLERTREGAAFQIGQALVAAGKSVHGALRLPLALAQIYRRVQARRNSAPGIAARSAPQTMKRSSTNPSGSASDGRLSARPGALPAASRTPARLPRPVRTLNALRVAAIMDEFTYHSFAPECDLLQLRTAGWRTQLRDFEPDLVFIESAWRGAEGDWALKISNPSEELAGLIEWAQVQGVPTVFWNKEDPVHFGGFLHVARAVDYVFTTDIDCIARYKREVGHDRVYLLPFAAQPAVHNPIERFPRDDAFCFAGSYYLKYPERQRDFRSLIDTVKAMRPVEIFDRNFDKPHPHYEFPPEYQPYIMGSLPFDQIDKAYKGYRYGINMNTIKQSQTMFARRVFELLASNTVVVSNFSRGMRLMFGDLVVASDEAAEIHRRLEPLADERQLRKFRLAGLRKVMAEHTYANRLAYIAQKLGAPQLSVETAPVLALAFASTQAELDALAAMWQRQALKPAMVVLTALSPQTPLPEGMQLAADVDALRRLPAYAGAEWVAAVSTADYHGRHYLLDLCQAVVYGGADAVGKAARYRVAPGGPELLDGEFAYRQVPRLPLRASALRKQAFEALQVGDAQRLDEAWVEGPALLAIDEFNFLEGAGAAPHADWCRLVDDIEGLRAGIDAPVLLRRAEAITASSQPDAQAAASAVPGLGAEQLAALLPAGAGASLVDGELRLGAALAEGKHRYVYLAKVFPRAELNLETNSRFQLHCEHDATLEVRTVFEFLDAEERKISHAMNKAGDAFSLPIPARCALVRVGLRLVGSGTLRIRQLVLADLRERPTAFLGTSRTLVLLKQYPDYADLYKYGFVHSRVRAYARARVATDVFRFSPDEPCTFREFENVDVTHGDRDLLELALGSGAYDHVLVHLMDRSMWESLSRHIDRVRVTVWVHGAEIQSWQRRAFEFERMDPAEVERHKKLSDQRIAFWREVLAQPHPNLHLVFVSRHFAGEVAEDLGIDLSTVPHSVIHNLVDGELFPYRRKQAEDRFRLLAIRPFVSRKYANDLLVGAIQELSRRPDFSRYGVTIVGEGEDFAQAREALGSFANVELQQRFLTQREIAQMHATHGVFLSPTRWDSQGVSRDEAMSSGLVPVSEAISAVPEFVDTRSGVLVAPESPAAIADAVEALAAAPERFLALSEEAARRAQSQCGLAGTIERELALFAPASSPRP